MTATPQKRVRVLFDEYHSESWSIDSKRAAEFNTHHPKSSSYQIAAQILAERDFILSRNLEKPLQEDLLNSCDLLVLLHPCDPKWEKTTSNHSPQLSSEEISSIQKFVSEGGGLIVLTEYEHEKYGDNLNTLLSPFGLRIENTTVVDPENCVQQNSTWIRGQPAKPNSPFSHLVQQACFYRTATCRADGSATMEWKTSPSADPAEAGLMATSTFGKGRVVLLTDSSLFGDIHIQEFDHSQLWRNIFYWSAAPRLSQSGMDSPSSSTLESSEWKNLKADVHALRKLQNTDGSIPVSQQGEAKKQVDSILDSILRLKPLFPHEKEYLDLIPEDFQAWVQGGFLKPDFHQSLSAFNPERDRRHHLEYLAVFPMYTPNASRDTRFEAILLRTPWPEWLADLERNLYQNDKFVPGHLIDFTEGYQSDCAVFFPETISVTQKPTNNFAMIFCDREAQRLQRCVLKASSIVHFSLHPQLECFLKSTPLVYDALALWDLIHDKSHSLGELPFDPFMIRQRAPYWMYALEELRVDLRSFCEASSLAQKGYPFAHYVPYAILLDRIFRFPITGNRIRNYDSLGGEILFAYLHQKDILLWSDNQLVIRWDLLLGGVEALRDELQKLYKMGADCSKMSFWIAAHDLISNYVRPNVASVWKRDSRIHMDETDVKKWIGLVLDDEFPLGNFHSNLLQKMSRSPNA